MKLKLGLMSAVIVVSAMAPAGIVYAAGAGAKETRVVDSAKIKEMFDKLEKLEPKDRKSVFEGYKERAVYAKELETITKAFVEKFQINANDAASFVVVFGAKGKTIIDDLVSGKNKNLTETQKTTILQLIERVGEMSANLYSNPPTGAKEDDDIILANKALSNLILTALPQITSGENKTSVDKYVDLIEKMLESMKSGSGKGGIEVRTLSDALRAGLGIEVLRALGLCK
jgi:hypothetical protein